ncbi:hypothetical protein [Pseudomonas sp. Irchel s3b5]|uniref:hypothetical protein n=1 Tax=Pseudomonas sp. Irchel s3b5 TaxID=2009077 RepID=UPI00117AA53E|nr:hypothetical protein [Pseudomonas sp. Irchel s3b5]
MFDSKLLSEICDSKLVFWAGLFPPTSAFKSSTRILDERYDFRQLPNDHGKYSAVYLTEIDLGQIKQWPLIMDEALRLLAHGGKTLLFIRFTQNDLLSIFALTAFLRKKSDFKILLNYQEQDPNGTYIYSLECHRSSPPPSLSTFEFALITNGQRPTHVKRFIESVANIRGIDNIDWTIAICGPIGTRQQTEALSNRVRYIDAPLSHAEKGWITRKKNLIVETSRSENLIIAHDRYEIPPDFLDAMFEYGPDFSVLVPAQIDQKGNRFPDWVSFGSQWSWAPCGMLSYDDYNPNIYINGGVIISKRSVLIETPWNDLLFWNQGEDIELSRCLIENGITPRLSRVVTLRATDARPGYTYDFANLASIDNAYTSPNGSPKSTQFTMGAFSTGISLELKHLTIAQLAMHGINPSKDCFFYTPDGLIPKKDSVDLAFGIEPLQNEKFTLSLILLGELKKADLALSLNGKSIAFELYKVDSHSVGISLSEAIENSNTCRNTNLTINTSKNYILQKILSSNEKPTSTSSTYPTHIDYPISFSSKRELPHSIFGTGWCVRETWGGWSDGKESELYLPIPESGRNTDIEFTLNAIAYAPKSIETQLVGVECNGLPITLIKLKKSKRSKKMKFRIPRTLINERGFVHIKLKIQHPSSPAEQNASKDNRLLGIGIISIDAKRLRTI